MDHEQAAQLKYLVKELIFSTVWAAHDPTQRHKAIASEVESKLLSYIDSLVNDEGGNCVI